jgi:hypothetical protein
MCRNGQSELGKKRSISQEQIPTEKKISFQEFASVDEAAACEETRKQDLEGELVCRV